MICWKRSESFTVAVSFLIPSASRLCILSSRKELDKLRYQRRVARQKAKAVFRTSADEGVFERDNPVANTSSGVGLCGKELKNKHAKDTTKRGKLLSSKNRLVNHQIDMKPKRAWFRGYLHQSSRLLRTAVLIFLSRQIFILLGTMLSRKWLTLCRHALLLRKTHVYITHNLSCICKHAVHIDKLHSDVAREL
jgi:hypothetical protein